MENSLSNLPDSSGPFNTQALRFQTMSAHRSVEKSLNLPECIKDLQDYRRWLVRFFGIYFPIEASLGSFSQWKEWDIPFDRLGHAKNLSTDIAAMDLPMQDVELASHMDIPHFAGFAEALGALYVIEGSKLGGKFILEDLSRRLGPAIEGATSFLAGHGAQMGQQWNSLKSSLDRFFLENPAEFPLVSAGVVSTFASVEAWMLPLTERSKL